MAAARRAAPSLSLVSRLAESEATAAAPGPSATVPFEVARLVSRRWFGLVELPVTVRAAISAAVSSARQQQPTAAAGADPDSISGSSRVAEAGGGTATTKQLRSSSHKLTDALRRMSRTEARGGVHERPEMDPVSGRRARPTRKVCSSRRRCLSCLSPMYNAARSCTSP